LKTDGLLPPVETVGGFDATSVGNDDIGILLKKYISIYFLKIVEK
jgi:hypothetical protein